MASWLRADDYRFERRDKYGAIKANDRLCRAENKIKTMRLFWNTLVAGGWLLSLTPSTDGRGAFQDPSHVSYWNQNAFWYWTREEQSKYLPPEQIFHQTLPPVRFQEVTLATEYPSRWHEEHKISYVRANLISLKGDYKGPGEKLI
jgi:hypothetical protein